jgi:hypothetical protein
MGTPPALYRGRMPVFYYLSASEAADVYQYLTRYPPSESPDVLAAASTRGPASTGEESDGKALSSALLSNKKPVPSTDADMGISALPWLAGSFAVLLLLAGGLITMREFRRIAAESAYRKWVTRNANLRTLSKVSVVLSAGLINDNPEEFCSKSGKFHATGSGY